MSFLNKEVKIGIVAIIAIIIIYVGIVFLKGLKIFNTDKNLPLTKVNFVATLMVKDFDTHGAMHTSHLDSESMLNDSNLDMTFMTNADTPYLAAKGLFEELHPFTGKNLKVEDKNKYTILNNSRAQSTRIRYEKSFTVKDSEWFTVRNNIFKNENWKLLKEEAD